MATLMETSDQRNNSQCKNWKNQVKSYSWIPVKIEKLAFNCSVIRFLNYRNFQINLLDLCEIHGNPIMAPGTKVDPAGDASRRNLLVGETWWDDAHCPPRLSGAGWTSEFIRAKWILHDSVHHITHSYSTFFWKFAADVGNLEPYPTNRFKNTLRMES